MITETIKNHVLKVIELRNNIVTGDEHFLNKIKSTIYTSYSADSDYINKYVIGGIDRHIENVKHKIYLTDSQINTICTYLGSVYDEKKHFLHRHIKSIIDNKLYTFDGRIEDIKENEALTGISIIYNIILATYLTDLVHTDEKNNVQAQKDKHKIEQAKKLLLQYTQDQQAIYCINSITQPTQKISKTIIERTLFYTLTKILDSNTNISKIDNASYSNNIILHILNAKRTRTISQETIKVKYKNYTLKYYKA